MIKDKFLELIETVEKTPRDEMENIYSDLFSRSLKENNFNMYVQTRVLLAAFCLLDDLKFAQRDFNVKRCFANGCTTDEIAKVYNLSVDKVSSILGGAKFRYQ